MRFTSAVGSAFVIAIFGCAHTSSSLNVQSCDDDTECPIGRRCSAGQCVSGDKVLAETIASSPSVESASPGEVSHPTQPSASPSASPSPSPSTTKTFSGVVTFGPIDVPVRWTVKLSTLDDPKRSSVTDRIRAIKNQLKQSTDGKRQELLDELMELCGQSRSRLRELGENEASLVEALMTLAEVWEYPEFVKRPPRNNGLVVAFPGTTKGGTLYCDKVASVVDDGGPGVDPAVLQMKSRCEGKELEAFMLVEAIADKGGLDSSHRCVAVAEAGGGSYQLLLRCLKSQR